MEKKVYCKKCDHYRRIGGAMGHNTESCRKVKRDTYYEEKEGNPSEINAHNDCGHFKSKKKEKKHRWYTTLIRYPFIYPWY